MVPVLYDDKHLSYQSQVQRLVPGRTDLLQVPPAAFAELLSSLERSLLAEPRF